MLAAAVLSGWAGIKDFSLVKKPMYLKDNVFLSQIFTHFIIHHLGNESFENEMILLGVRASYWCV